QPGRERGGTSHRPRRSSAGPDSRALVLPDTTLPATGTGGPWASTRVLVPGRALEHPGPPGAPGLLGHSRTVVGQFYLAGCSHGAARLCSAQTIRGDDSHR